MTDHGAPAEDSTISMPLAAPRWMSKAEKALFASVISARNAAGNPVSETEIDLLADYVCSRSRIAALRKFLKKEIAQAKGYGPCERDAAAFIRQIDTTTSLSRRLARELKL